MESYFLPVNVLFGVLVSLCITSLLTSFTRDNQNDNNRHSLVNKDGTNKEKNSCPVHARKKASRDIVTFEKMGKTLNHANGEFNSLKNFDAKSHSISGTMERRVDSEIKYMSTDIDEMIGIRESISFMQKQTKKDITMEFKQLGNLQKQVKNDLVELKQSLSLYISQNKYTTLNARNQTNSS